MNHDDVLSTFRTIETVGSAAGKALPGAAGFVVTLIGETAGLVADLLALGEEPRKVVTEIRSSLPSFDAAMQRSRDRINARFGQGPE
jgi:hypothetical protein